MYHIGDRVVYGIHGVCRIVDQESKTVDGKSLIYLVLEPEGETGSRYLVPTHNAAAMGKLRCLLSKEELTAMLDARELGEDRWIPDEHLRKQTYRDLINSADRKKLIQMVRSVYSHKTSQFAAGRKVHLCDDNFLKDAEKLLAGEICAVMGLDFNQAKQFLRGKVKEDA